MTQSKNVSNANRREFLKTTGSLAAGATMLAAAAQNVHAAEDNTIRLALIGCGGRGTGAVRDALSVPDSGPVELYAMADLQRDPMDRRHKALQAKFGKRINVPEDRKFIGFDAYRKAIDSLRPGDVALCTTRAYIRAIHVAYAVEKGINVFMEKPFASDPVGLQRILRAGEAAEKKNVKIAAGLQCRHSPARQALIDRIRDGAMGDIPLIRANRLGGTGWLGNKGEDATKLLKQMQFGRVNLFWVGSGHMVDYLIHQIDECCWIKDAWPVSCNGMGGRVPHSQDCSQNIDVYEMEFTFADGTKAFCGFRRIRQTRNEFATFVHGTKCAAQFSGNVHAATVHQFKDQRIGKEFIDWTPEKDKFSPWQYEWNHLIASIRNDRHHNEAKRAAYSDMTAQMGRAACHIGQTVTWDDVMNSKFHFCDNLEDMDYDTPVPVKPDSEGRFPVPIPGQWKEL